MRKITLAALPLILAVLSVNAEDGKQAGQVSGPGAYGRTLPPSQVVLHDLMEPIWRAPTKAEGVARACTNTEAMQTRVDAAVRDKGLSFVGMSKTASQIAHACKEDRSEEVAGMIVDLHHQFHKMMESN